MQGIGATLALGATLFVSAAIAADTPPHLDTSGVNMQPAYPASALPNSERGAAVIGVNVSETGKVNYAYPLQTSGFNDLDSAAIAGVMGWRLIPATSNGKNVAGDTAVQIVFEPPHSPDVTAKPATDTPGPAGDFLPKAFQIEAKRGEYETKDGSVLCTNGTLRTTIKFQHSDGPVGWGWAPAASIKVGTGKDDVVVLQMVGHERITPPQETFTMKRHQGDDQGALGYSHSTTLGRPETVSLSWDSTGLVTALVGALEKHQAQLKGPPSQFWFAMSSGAAKFTNSALICTPGSST
jgi:TonB family protein